MDINKQIEDNLGLVYHTLGKFNLFDDPDAVSFAYEALYRAIKTYDASTGNAFSTYAICVISNALRCHLRSLNKKRQIQIVSYDEPISTEENAPLLLDTLSVNESVEDTYHRNELSKALYRAIDTVIDAASSKVQQSILNAWRDSNFECTQQELATIVGVSQATVSRTISSFRYKLSMELEDYLC